MEGRVEAHVRALGPAPLMSAASFAERDVFARPQGDGVRWHADSLEHINLRQRGCRQLSRRFFVPARRLARRMPVTARISRCIIHPLTFMPSRVPSLFLLALIFSLRPILGLKPVGRNERGRPSRQE